MLTQVYLVLTQVQWVLSQVRLMLSQVYPVSSQADWGSPDVADLHTHENCQRLAVGRGFTMGKSSGC